MTKEEHEHMRMIFNKYIPEEKAGYFIEIGAANGIHNSNTYFLEKECGWNGVCIEAEPNTFKKLEQTRNVSLVNAACSDVAGEKLEFIICGQLSGFMETAGIHKKILNKKKEESDKNVVTLETRTLTSVLDEVNAPKNIDFLSLDTEGSELKILHGLDLEKYNIKMILVEHNREQPKRLNIRQLLESKNYTRKEIITRDDLYLKNE